MQSAYSYADTAAGSDSMEGMGGMQMRSVLDDVEEQGEDDIASYEDIALADGMEELGARGASTRVARAYECRLSVPAGAHTLTLGYRLDGRKYVATA